MIRREVVVWEEKHDIEIKIWVTWAIENTESEEEDMLYVIFNQTQFWY